jgi:gluconokinase
MGVAGSGKTALGLAAAAASGRPFADADDLHSPENVAKMAAGEALTDADRVPWLGRVAARLAAADGVVLACSALKRAYRDRLRQGAAFQLIYLVISPEEAARRLASRKGHFFAPDLLASQFAALEPPDAWEAALTIPAETSSADAVARIAMQGA